MTAEIELKKAAVKLKIEQEELLSKYSEDRSGVGEASPALTPKASPDAPRSPIGSPSKILQGVLPIIHVKTVAMLKEATVKQEVSSAQFLSNVPSLYAPLPNLQKTNLSADVHDFIPCVHPPKETPCPLFAKKKGSSSPPEQRLS